jgi:hypothetical protein
MDVFTIIILSWNFNSILKEWFFNASWFRSPTTCELSVSRFILFGVPGNSKTKIRAFAVAVVTMGQPQFAHAGMFPTRAFNHMMGSLRRAGGINVGLTAIIGINCVKVMAPFRNVAAQVK